MFLQLEMYLSFKVRHPKKKKCVTQSETNRIYFKDTKFEIITCIGNFLKITTIYGAKESFIQLIIN